MFHSMKQESTTNIERSLVVLTVVALTFVLLAACRRPGSAPSSGSTPPAIPDGARSEVVISGAINKSYTPLEVKVLRISDDVGVLFVETEACGVSVQFPIETQPGTYSFGDHLHQPVVDVLGEYAPDCGTAGVYLSTQGTLKLTESGSKYAGTFAFTAGNHKDQSKTIQVSGAFNDLSLP